MLISAHDIGKSFSDNLIFKNVTLTIEDKCRYGLIGVNGAGKSTLLSVLLGELENDEGELYIKNDIRMGVLKQNSGLERDSSIIAEMRKAFEDVYEAEREMRDIESKMSTLSNHESDEHRRLAAAYGAKQAYFDSRDGYGVEIKIKTVLNGMGFSDRDLDTPINILSGGEKTRLAIAKLLLEEPELLVLDEPMAGLDPEGRKAIMSYVKEYHKKHKTTVIFVTHSMEDAAQNAERLIAMDKGKILMQGTPSQVFEKAELLRASGLDTPQVTDLFAELKRRGFSVPDSVYTVEYACEFLRKLKGGKA